MLVLRGLHNWLGVENEVGSGISIGKEKRRDGIMDSLAYVLVNH